MPYLLILVLALFSFNTQASETTQTLVSSTTPPTLLELYSSQGCSSCPPAQAWVNKIKHSEDLWQQVIPMVFHVDYWDYLGWKDPYSSREHSERQRKHKRLGNVKAVYTPGFVVNGDEWTGWFNGHRLPIPIADDSQKATLRANLTSQGINAQYIDIEGQALSAPTINVAILGFDVQTPVTRGENARRTLPEEFIVLGAESYSFNSNKTYPWPKVDYDGDKQAVVVWLSDRTKLTPIHAVAGYINEGVF